MPDSIEIHGDQTIETNEGMSGVTIVLLAAVILAGVVAVVIGLIGVAKGGQSRTSGDW